MVTFSLRGNDSMDFSFPDLKDRIATLSEKLVHLRDSL
jgi:hypothetical protein